MVIFHSHVSLPEGTWVYLLIAWGSFHGQLPVRHLPWPAWPAPGGCMSTLEGRLAALKADRCTARKKQKKKRSKEKQLK